MTTQVSRSEANNQDTQAIVVAMAEKFGVDETKLLDTLKATAFRQSGDNVITDEQMFALLIVSNQYNLNPFTKEIYAFPDYKSGGIVPVVSVDGWNRIANENPLFDGVEFVYSKEVVTYTDTVTPVHTWIEAVLYRKDRNNPIRVREYVDECYRGIFVDQWGNKKPGPWQSHPKRMLRHKALIQCYRVGFGFVGIYDEDEAYRIINADSDLNTQPARAKVVPLKPQNVANLEQKPAATLDVVKGDTDKELVPAQADAIPESDTSEQTQDAAPQPIPQGSFNQEKVDEFLEKLLPRAKENDQWHAAEELIRERLSGPAADYALNVLSTERANNATSEQTDIEGETVSAEIEQTQDGNESENDTSAQSDNVN